MDFKDLVSINFGCQTNFRAKLKLSEGLSSIVVNLLTKVNFPLKFFET